jgi:hypothetical protein
MVIFQPYLISAMFTKIPRRHLETRQPGWGHVPWSLLEPKADHLALLRFSGALFWGHGAEGIQGESGGQGRLSGSHVTVLGVVLGRTCYGHRSQYKKCSKEPE